MIGQAANSLSSLHRAVLGRELIAQTSVTR
jgi:hypothetical protein